MGNDDYEQQIDIIKTAVGRIFATAQTEEEVCTLERSICNEIMYLAAIAQSELVKPDGGWDRFGR
ncbi:MULTISPECIES: hypothetical protein [Gordonibacter]|uniref:Uncharacterized protein n=1 Tax=Gordonibacter faecis TaxID=3047475 RepID=A0ABT7DN85_9ACTN|nr:MULTISPECIES: hypothetical protein [unclassified Gordonibacter]MDJ1650687.1 hypothetical protein [Gordonibacter sp. KGMB12511]HIW75853.1 hypothetical protein [Candidatus Gordonibacter avicola]